MDRITQTSLLIKTINGLDSDAVLPVVDEYLTQARTDGPIVSLDDIQADAVFWADIATQTELRLYAGACLRRLKDQPFGHATRKQLFVQLWEAMGTADRHAFLNRVDPQGNFQRGIAA